MTHFPISKSRVKALAMAVSLGLTGGLAAMQNASADAVLFPYFDTRPGYVTFIAMANKSSAEDWRWAYRYDDPSTPDNDCLFLDGFGMTVANDFVSVDISNTLGTNMGLPTGIDTTSSAFHIGPGWQGLLTVYAFTGAYPGTPTAESSLSGEAAVINLATGETSKYEALNDLNDNTEGNLDDLAYGAQGGAPGTDVMPTVIWHPTSIINTSLYVAVTDDTMVFNADKPTAAVAFADVNGSPGNFYDVNGNLFSATSGLDVTCFDTFTLSDFLPGASLTFAGAGGWANVQITDLDLETPGNQPPFSDHRGILVYKKELTSAIGGNMINTWVRQNRVEY